MAPKAMKRSSTASKAMKRPAIATTPARIVKKVQSVSKCTVKQPKVAKKSTVQKLRISVAKSRTIIEALKDTQGVPACVRKMLVMLRERKLDANGHGEAISMLGTILSEKDRILQHAVCALQADVDGSEKEKASRVEAQSASESRVEELKNKVVVKKASLDTACKIIEGAQGALAEGKAGRKRERVALGNVTRKKERLESTKENTFAQLKQKAAHGIKGQKQLNELRKVGKEFGFHEVLLGSIPAVLRKQPDRRQTFDALAMRSFSSEFSKTVDKLGVAAKENEAAVAEHMAAEQAAQEDLRVAKETRTKSTKELSEAESALAAAQSELATTKQRLRDFPKDAKATSRRFVQAKAQLSAFRAGPLAVMEELQRLAQTFLVATEAPTAVENQSGKNEFERDELSVGQKCAAQEGDLMATLQLGPTVPAELTETEASIKSSGIVERL